MIHMYTTLVMKQYKKGNQIELEQKGAGNVFFLKRGTIKIVSLLEDGGEIIKLAF